MEEDRKRQDITYQTKKLEVAGKYVRLCGGSGRCATPPRERVDVYKSRCVTRYVLFSRQHNYATGLDRRTNPDA